MTNEYPILLPSSGKPTAIRAANVSAEAKEKRVRYSPRKYHKQKKSVAHATEYGNSLTSRLVTKAVLPYTFAGRSRACHNPRILTILKMPRFMKTAREKVSNLLSVTCGKRGAHQVARKG